MMTTEVTAPGKNTPILIFDKDFRAALFSSDVEEVPVDLTWTNVPVEIADTPEFLEACLREVPPARRAEATINVVEYAGGTLCQVTTTYTKMAHTKRVTVGDLDVVLARA